MPIKKEYIVYSGIAAVAIAATIIITSIFKGFNKPDEKLYQDYKERLENEVKEVRDRLKDEVEYRIELKASYEQYMRNDSALIALLKENQAKYNSINKGYAEVPNRINKLAGSSDNEIARAFTEY